MNSLLSFSREPSLVDKAWMALRYPVDLVYHPMDALVSLPALSFLVIPAFSSYGTTINFLFFYMTWAVLIKSNPPLQVELVGTLAIRVLFYLLPSLGFLLFDSAAPSVAVQLKEHGERAMPLGAEYGGKKGRWWKIALVSCMNVFIGIALQASTELLFTKVLCIRSALKLSTGLPMPWSIAKNLVFGLLLREGLTYALHRYALHSPKSPLTRMHESWQHSVMAPIAFVAHYDHPLAYIVHVFLPMYIPAVFLRLHLLTYQLYLIIVSLEEAFAYSGYNILPSGFILGGIARRQERHLMGGGDGNFGCFGLADYVCGTSGGTDILDDVVDEADEQHVGEKAKGKAKSLKGKAQKKRISSTDEDDEDEYKEDEDAVEVEAEYDLHGKDDEDPEEPKVRKARNDRKGRKIHGEDEKANVEDERERVEKPKKNGKIKGRNEQNSSGDTEDVAAGAEKTDQKPERKASSAGKNSKRQTSRAKKRSEGED